MSDRYLYYFTDSAGSACAALPMAPAALVSSWSGLRARMVRTKPDAFTRDEWAFLIDFLDEHRLSLHYRNALGRPVDVPSEPLARFLRPRRNVALWLPNNVSLLGPLLLVLVSLVGSSLRIKSGSRSDNLTAEFLRFALDALPEGPLRRYLATVDCAAFDRTDPRNRAMAESSEVRLVFGGDQAARAIDTLPHPIESIGFAFTDRRSEAWLAPECLDDDQLLTLLRVFAVYGQTGCTSPHRVVLLNASEQDALTLRDRLVSLWLRAHPRTPEAHQASANQLARQWAAALSWDARIAGRHAAVIAVGTLDHEPCPAPMLLSICPARLEEAVAALPANIQTIGHVIPDPSHERWLDMLARTRVRRFVPLARMHHFGHIWDGWAFWRSLFEEVEMNA